LRPRGPQPYLAVDFAAARHAAEVVQQRCEQGVLPLVLVRLGGPDAGETRRLAGVRQVEDAVRGGAVGGLLVDEGRGHGDQSRGRCHSRCRERGQGGDWDRSAWQLLLELMA